jgi:hypothetical protein
MQQQTASACCVDSVAKHSHAHSTAPVQHSSSTAHSKPARGKLLNCGALQLRDRAIALLQYCIIQPYFALYIERWTRLLCDESTARARRGAVADWLLTHPGPAWS